jgi:hypothetical protein
MIMGQEVIVSPLKGAVNYEHRYYPNGAIEMFWNSQRQYAIYNTGDIVFFGMKDGIEFVRGIITHDGLRFGDMAPISGQGHTG